MIRGSVVDYLMLKYHVIYKKLYLEPQIWSKESERGTEQREVNIVECGFLLWILWLTKTTKKINIKRQNFFFCYHFFSNLPSISLTIIH